MNSLFTTLFAVRLVETLVFASVIALAIFVLTLIILRLTPQTRPALRATIIAAALGLMIGSLPWVYVSVYSSPVITIEPLEHQAGAITTESTNPADFRSDQPEVEKSSTYLFGKVSPWIALIYLFGTSIMFFRLILALSRSFNLARKARLISDSSLIDCRNELSNRFGIKKAPALSTLKGETIPFVTGLLSPMIVIPAAALANLTPDQLRMVIAHEMAHLSRKDHWIIILQRMAESLFFFHPAVWILSRLLDREREHACDDLVVQLGHSRLDYAETLVCASGLSHLTPLDSPLALAVNGNRGQLGNRVRRILEIRPPVAAIPGRVCFSAIVMVVFCVFLFHSLSIRESDGAEEIEKPVTKEEAVKVARAAVAARWEVDKGQFTGAQLQAIETEYQKLADLSRSSIEFVDGTENLVKKYPKANRTGCLFLYLARSLHGTTRTGYLRRAIDEFGTCRYGDGVNVGAYAMYVLADDLINSGKEDEAKSLITELTQKHPNALDHSGNLIREYIANLTDRPTVASATPDNGQNDVSPDLKEIRIQFSQPMAQGGRSIVGGGDSFPEITGKITWADDRTVVIPVKLKPNHQYWMSINSKKFTNFRSAKGASAVPYPIEFKTGS